MQPAGQPPPQGPLLLSLGRKDTTRLLEVYVKRSLSVNDGSLPQRKPWAKAQKWVTPAEGRQAVRRSSSDSSAHLGPDKVLASFKRPLTEARSGAPLAGVKEQETKPGRTRKDAKREKKPSTWKRFLGLFSKKRGEEKEAREHSVERTGACSSPDSPRDSLLDLSPDIPSPPVSCLSVPNPFGGDQGSPRSGKSLKKRRSLLKLSFRSRDTDATRTQREPSFRILPGPPDEAVVCVEPSSTYYEKVSEELERIVKEVKDSPSDEDHATFAECIQKRASMVAAEDEECIEKIISLLKQQGDAIDVKIKDNVKVSSFFQSLSYRDFQQLADRYMEEEIPSQLPQDTAAPELLKFAFTLDFTAKVAGLANQAVSRIMGFGNQYLQDRFTQMSKAHVLTSRAEAAQSFSGPD
ncbi:uncharacterized protein LOC118780390 [Megalops cyprinoides]|uniref:uncharacterized protein LOC118780390 n=1 Tax=Megalops cyprinoides TaxID=118141 RepID=UPI001864F659|nr:uncharacterized protein LOC118780390 [Megalops cyprinoides]